MSSGFTKSACTGPCCLRSISESGFRINLSCSTLRRSAYRIPASRSNSTSATEARTLASRLATGAVHRSPQSSRSASSRVIPILVRAVRIRKRFGMVFWATAWKLGIIDCSVLASLYKSWACTRVWGVPTPLRAGRRRRRRRPPGPARPGATRSTTQPSCARQRRRIAPGAACNRENVKQNPT